MNSFYRFYDANDTLLTCVLYLGSIANVTSDCPFYYSSTSYDAPSATLRMSFDVPSLSEAPQCNAILNPAALGYDRSVDGNNLNLNIDVHTLFSALVVANLVNGPNTLHNFVTMDKFTEFSFHGVDYAVYRKFDRFVGGWSGGWVAAAPSLQL